MTRVLMLIMLIAILSLIGPYQLAPVHAEWPMFTGDGDRTPTRQGIQLVDHLDDAPMLWS